MNSEDRRLQIINGAISVLVEKGIAASRMNDFVDASGLSKGGVYHHFSCKEDILVGVLNHFMHNSLERIRPSEMPSSDSAYDQLAHLLRDYQSMIKELGQYHRLFIDFLAQSPYMPRIRDMFSYQYEIFFDVLKKIINNGIARKEFKASIDPEAIAAGLRGVFDGVGFATIISTGKAAFLDHAIISAMCMIEGIRIQPNLQAS